MNKFSRRTNFKNFGNEIWFAGFLYGIFSYYAIVLQLLYAIYLSNRFNFH